MLLSPYFIPADIPIKQDIQTKDRLSKILPTKYSTSQTRDNNSDDNLKHVIRQINKHDTLKRNSKARYSLNKEIARTFNR